LFNPFTTKVIIVPVRTKNIEVSCQLSFKKNLHMKAKISILCQAEKSKATEIVGEIGMDYESKIILPVSSASATDVTAKYMAKDMHTGNLFGIETAIKQ
jgi:hypothetical protein